MNLISTNKGAVEEFKDFKELSETDKKEMGKIVLAIGGISLIFYMAKKAWKLYSDRNLIKLQSKMNREEDDNKTKNRIQVDNAKTQNKCVVIDKKDEIKRKRKECSKSENSNEADMNDIENMAESKPITSFNEILSTPCELEKNLVGPIFPSGGITLLAGETGLGKTSFTTQAMFQLVGMKESKLFPNSKTDNIQNVVYFDYELTNNQFCNRYKFIKDRINNFFPEFTENTSSLYLVERIKHYLSIMPTHTTFVIDNITMLDDLKSKPTVKIFISKLKAIQKEYKDKFNVIVSFIIVAHTELKKASYKPIEKKDIAASSCFVNFADSIVVIGNTCFKDTILLKKLKNRNGKANNGSAHVFKRKEEGLLYYEYQGEFSESDVLPKKDGTLDPISTLKKYNQVNNNEAEYKTEAKRGRKPQLSEEDVIQMLYHRSQGMSKNAVSIKYDVTRQAYNKALKRYGLVDNFN